MNFKSPVVDGEISGAHNVVDLDEKNIDMRAHQPEEIQTTQENRRGDRAIDIESNFSSCEKATKVSTGTTSSSDHSKDAPGPVVAIDAGHTPPTPPSPSMPIEEEEEEVSRWLAVIVFCTNLTCKSLIMFIIGLITAPFSFVIVLLLYVFPILPIEWMESDLFEGFMYGSMLGVTLVAIGMSIYGLYQIATADYYDEEYINSLSHHLKKE